MEVDAGEDGLLEDAPAEVRTGEIGADEVRLREHGAIEPGVAKICTRQVLSDENGGGQVRPLEIDATSRIAERRLHEDASG